MLEIGQVFLTEQDIARIENQEKWSLMFNGEYIFQKKRVGNKLVDVDPLIPIASMLSEVNADLLFGEFPNITFGNETDDNKIWDLLPNDFQTQLIESASYTSALGSMFCVFYKKEDQTYWKWVTPQNCTIEKDENGITEFRMFYRLPVKNANNWAYYSVQEYEYQEGVAVINRYKIKVDSHDMTIKSIYDVEDSEIIEWGFIPVCEIDNLRAIGQWYGKSDYQGKEQLFSEIDGRLDQINTVLAEHSDPWIGLPPGVLDKDGNFNRRQGKMFEKVATSTGNEDITIAQWDARLDNAFESIDKMIEMVLFTSRIAPAIAGWTKAEGGVAESGRALKWRMVSTLAMRARKQRYWEDFFYNFFWMLSQIDSNFSGLQVDNMVIEWKDGLPIDDSELIANTTQAVNSKIMSRLTAVMKTQELDEPQAHEEMARIDNESARESELEAQGSAIVL
jgi:SPP1 family phage portal protein